MEYISNTGWNNFITQDTNENKMPQEMIKITSGKMRAGQPVPRRVLVAYKKLKSYVLSPKVVYLSHLSTVEEQWKRGPT